MARMTTVVLRAKVKADDWTPTAQQPASSHTGMQQT